MSCSPYRAELGDPPPYPCRGCGDPVLTPRGELCARCREEELRMMDFAALLLRRDPLLAHRYGARLAAEGDFLADAVLGLLDDDDERHGVRK